MKVEHEERRVECEERKVECEEREKAKSGVRAELEPHFKLDLGLFFSLGLMATPTIIFSLVIAYIDTHNPF